MKKWKSHKAHAWSMVAQWTEEAAKYDWYNAGLDEIEDAELIRNHILKSIVPSLRRRAKIIERNRKRSS